MLFTVIFGQTTSVAQVHKPSPRALKIFKEAETTLLFSPDDALTLYQKSIAVDSLFAAPYMRIGQILSRRVNQKASVLNCYERAVALDSNERAFLNIYEYLGIEYLRKGDYRRAKNFFSGYLRLSSNPQHRSHRSVQRYLRQCEYAQQQLNTNGTSYVHAFLPPPLNEALSQTYPVLTADLETMFFTRNNGDEDIYTTQWLGQTWSSPRSLSNTINTHLNEGTCAISADGRTLIFSACHRSTNFGKCDLYSSHKKRGFWTTPINLGPTINSSSWQSHPALSADGTQLYFSSDRQGGIGGKDIWLATLDSAGYWQQPVNLGVEINTEFDEISPFIHANNFTLFFASDGWQSMGGFDIFITKQQSNRWLRPVNMGYPLNDYADQMGFYVAPDCQRAYYSNHKRGQYYDNNTQISTLCSLTLPDTLKDLCPAMYHIKGIVRDSKTQKSLGVTVKIVSRDEKENNRTSIYHSDDSTGVFMGVVSEKLSHTIQFIKPGYFHKHINLKDYPFSTLQSGEWQVELIPMEQQTAIVIQNALFDKGSATMPHNISQELNQLADYLKANPKAKVLIEGHTDDVGTVSFNETLSLQRATVIKGYFVQRGIKTTQLIVRGLGKSRPLIKADTEEARQQNRRVECKLIQQL